MIISASFRTDIPTFPGKWFVRRLRAGYRNSINPYCDTGSGTGWPTALAHNCSEAAAASKNNDGITCYGSSGYNNHNGDWLRGGTYNSVTNQSSIDLSPAVDKALGWVYPSSGLARVSWSALP
jgi:hypothetical protein